MKRNYTKEREELFKGSKPKVPAPTHAEMAKQGEKELAEREKLAKTAIDLLRVPEETPECEKVRSEGELSALLYQYGKYLQQNAKQIATSTKDKNLVSAALDAMNEITYTKAEPEYYDSIL